MLDIRFTEKAIIDVEVFVPKELRGVFFAIIQR